MLFGSYRFHCRFDTEAQLPPYKGSTFRGVFGRALKELIGCRLAEDHCKKCPDKNHCLYVSVFEPKLNETLPRPKNGSDPPNPYVIEPPLNSKTHYEAGQDFRFNLLLFGKINYSLPILIHAIKRMGRSGVGSGGKSCVGTFHIRAVYEGRKLLFDGLTQTPLQPRNILVAHQAPNSNVFDTLTITLKTPFRTKYKNHLHPELPFHLLVRRLQYRASSLMTVWEDGEPSLDYKGLVRRAEGITPVYDGLRWFDWKRHSTRQDEEMLFGGIVGTITYRNVPIDYLPLLEFGALTHIGKETAFGLGKFEFSLNALNGEIPGPIK